MFHTNCRILCRIIMSGTKMPNEAYVKYMGHTWHTFGMCAQYTMYTAQYMAICM